MLLATLREVASDAHDHTVSNVMNSSHHTGLRPRFQVFYPTTVKKSTRDKDSLVRIVSAPADFCALNFWRVK